MAAWRSPKAACSSGLRVPSASVLTMASRGVHGNSVVPRCIRTPGQGASATRRCSPELRWLCEPRCYLARGQPVLAPALPLTSEHGQTQTCRRRGREVREAVCPPCACTCTAPRENSSSQLSVFLRAMWPVNRGSVVATRVQSGVRRELNPASALQGDRHSFGAGARPLTESNRES